ncbi:hypothetical protein [Erysipelatoclostridium sp. An173]|uniref:hypothetical protein n=1 Tax=Erysipelatoclostridium sp. An173 TaxID=1965571 RepID=UPI0032091105
MKKIEEVFCMRSEDEYSEKLNKLTKKGYKVSNKKIVRSEKLGYYFIISIDYRNQKYVEE